jgi:hypothetical protein
MSIEMYPAESGVLRFYFERVKRGDFANSAPPPHSVDMRALQRFCATSYKCWQIRNAAPLPPAAIKFALSQSALRCKTYFTLEKKRNWHFILNLN